MPKLTKENASLLAEVKYKDKIFYIVKINEKSVYLAPDKNFLEKHEERIKGTTWKDFCAKNGAIMVSYSSVINIGETEIAKGKNFIVSKKKIRYLTKIEEKQVKERFVKYSTGKSGSKSFFESARGRKIVPLDFNINGQALIRKDDIYFFYDIELDEYTFFKSLGDGKKELVWPRQEEIKELKKVV